MPLLSRLAIVAVLVSLVACTAPAVAAPSPTPTPSPAPAASPLALPEVADLPFPEPRKLPIRLPETATPIDVIDAFLDFVHDPALTYHADGAGRWVSGDLEILVASSMDRVGPNEYFQLAHESSTDMEGILQNGVAAVRQGAGSWFPVDPSFLRHLDSLSSAVVVGDLGPEPNGGGYRLAISAGFDTFPREAAEGGGRPLDVTEIVIDETGRPSSLSFHRWSIPSAVGQASLVEGYVVYKFTRFGEPMTIPSLPGGDPRVVASEAAPLALARVAIPGGYSVLMAGRPQTETRGLTFNGPDNRSTGLDVAYTHVDSGTGLRFEAGSSKLPAIIFTSLSDRERLRAVRSATSSRIGGGDVLGYREVEIEGQVGEEVVAEGEYLRSKTGLFRIRNVFFDDRLIVLSVGGPIEGVGSAAADEFLASLKHD